MEKEMEEVTQSDPLETDNDKNVNETIDKQTELQLDKSCVTITYSGNFKRSEELLNNQLQELKKENHSLQKCINSWQLTLEKKVQELKQTDVKLNGFYKEIWSERDKFCSSTEKVNDDVGVLSDWWNTQMKIVSDLENLRQKRLQEKKCGEEIKMLQKEVDELRKKHDKENTQIVEVEVHTIQPDESKTEVTEKSEEISIEEKICCAKRIRFSDKVEIIEPKANLQTRANDLFAMVDVDYVRLANRRRNVDIKNPFISKLQKFLTSK